MREPRNYEAPLCAQTGMPDAWFPEQGKSRTVESLYARSICNNCIHQAECAEWGIRNEEFGIWGGLTSYERQLIRRQANINLPKEERIA